jgi:hypothetical protein
MGEDIKRHNALKDEFKKDVKHATNDIFDYGSVLEEEPLGLINKFIVEVSEI